MNIKNEVKWIGEGWYRILNIEKGVRKVIPHPYTNIFYAPITCNLVADGKYNYNYLRDKPGPYEARKYWRGQSITILQKPALECSTNKNNVTRYRMSEIPEIDPAEFDLYRSIGPSG